MRIRNSARLLAVPALLALAGCGSSSQPGHEDGGSNDAGGEAGRRDRTDGSSPRPDGRTTRADSSRPEDATHHDGRATDAGHDADATRSLDGARPDSGSGCVPGEGCTPTNACDQGTVSCTAGVAGCTDTGQSLPDGTPCGAGLACKAGQCAPTTGDAGVTVSVGWCNVQWPPAIPDQAAGIPLPRAGTTVTWPGNAAAIYGRVFASGVTTVAGNQALVVGDLGIGPVGSDPTDPSQASQWTWQPMTYNPSCLACGQNYEYEINPTAPATAGVYAYATRFSGDARVTYAYCAGSAGTSSGSAYDPSAAPQMTVAGPGCQPVAAACGGDTDCCAGLWSCVDSRCTCPAAGQDCTPVDACHKFAMACAVDAGPSCEDTGTPVTDGTPCGTGTVCTGGACVPIACTDGAPCVPANPCDTGTESCADNVVTACNDTGQAVADGMTCGAGLTCKAGACVSSCTDGAACTPSNACHQGSVDCSGGTSSCTDTGMNAVDGTSCGQGEICSAGSCVCPSVPGTTLTLCPGGCVDLTSDEYSCGACGNVCPSSYLCYESFCFPDGHLGRRLGDGI